MHLFLGIQMVELTSISIKKAFRALEHAET